jgi:glycolate dehydrogenase FAD-binding subunit
VDLSGYAIDGVAPVRVHRPANAAEVADAIGGAHGDRTALVLWGGGTRVQIGSAPTRYDAALDLGGLRGVLEHSPADLVCTVRAGTTLAELDAELERSGQRWPIDAAHRERATVGGTIASAAPAPSRLRHQHVRDWIIGCEAVLGDGTRARAGGRVVKNVTGYDLTRLYSGSYGTLAALVEVSLKLVARDQARRSFRLRDTDVARLVSIASGLRALPLDSLALATREGALHARVAGSRSAVDRLSRELAGFDEVDETAWDALADRIASATTVARVATPPWRETEYLDTDTIAYAGTGSTYVLDASIDDLRAMRTRAEAASGALILERASAADKGALGVWGAPRVPAAIARALKQRFDPHDVLAPGRMP